MEQLRVDTPRVRGCAQALTVLTGELDACEQRGADPYDAVGHGGLAGVLDDLEGDWTSLRLEVHQTLSVLARSVRAIADQLEQADADLAGQAPGR